MPYPDVPDLVPFEADMTPNLMDGGSYAVQLDTIELYLTRLGLYVDEIAATGVGGYVLPEATSVILGGVYVADDEDFIEFMGL